MTKKKLKLIHTPRWLVAKIGGCILTCFYMWTPILPKLKRVTEPLKSPSTCVRSAGVITPPPHNPQKKYRYS